MAKYRKMPVVIEAHQWHKNGDHPEDYSKEREDYQDANFRRANNWEGDIVRYFRRPDVPGESLCGECEQPFHVHGWIDTLEGGHRVCPGDWIITGVRGERYPCKDKIFRMTYEHVDDDPD